MLKRTSRSAWTSSRSVQASRIASSRRNKASSSASGRSNTKPVSPKPCERRWVGELLPRELCELPQNHIPGGVAERIIDVLEAVDINERQPKPFPRLFLHPVQPAGQHLAEVAAVSKGHKRITTGKLTQHTRVLLQAAEHDVEHGP